MMKKLLIIKCGDTIPDLVARKGDFDDWIIKGTGLNHEQTFTVNVEKDERLPDPEEISGVVISGSHAMVTEQRPWSEQTAGWLANTVGQIPMLGICYGHQLLGYALGGKVADNPNGREMGMVRLDITPAAAGDRLLGNFLPSMIVPVSHKQSLVELPAGATLLASSAREPHQAFRFGDNAWGLQFHPEFDAEITTTYIDYCHDALVAENQNPDDLRKSCIDSGKGSELLQNFRRIIQREPFIQP
jgi:GMP synthase (glutamine-hydrolysing)